jgi:hypothetical protein
VKVRRLPGELGKKIVVLNGTVVNKVDLDDSYTPNIILYKAAQAGVTGCEKTAYELGGDKTFCQFYNSDNFVIPDLLKASDLPAQGNCPIKKV